MANPLAITTHWNLTGDVSRLTDYARHRLQYALGRLANRIESVALVVEDQNGPRGGVDLVCKGHVHLRPRGLVTVRVLGADAVTLVDAVSVRLRESVTRVVGRRRRHRRTTAHTSASTDD